MDAMIEEAPAEGESDASAPAGAAPGRALSLAVGALAAGVLTLQIGLTRIFSVTTQYHFAFLSVSLALLGLAAGAIVVRARPRWFAPGQVETSMAWAGLAAAVATPAVLASVHALRLTGKALPFFLLFPAVPFTAAGIGLALAYAAHARSAGRVYGADLLGAGLGCLLIIPALAGLGGPGALVALSLLFVAVPLLVGRGTVVRVAVVWGAVLVVTLVGTLTAGWLRVVAHKSPWDHTREMEAWNSFSRIAVMPMPDGIPPGWGLDAVPYPPTPPLKLLNIDADAATLLVGIGTTEGSPEFLRHDLTAVAIRRVPEHGRVLVLGSGGGKDVLAALLGGAERVQAVEVNPLIVRTVEETYGDFTGRPYSHPRVDLAVEDARTFLARDPSRYDRVVLGLVDSWSATSAGAFFLTENHLYTREAVEAYLDHLAPGGILSLSRWSTARTPAETLRAAVTVRAALEARGIERPLDHLIVLERPVPQLREDLGVGVVLASTTSFVPVRVQQMLSGLAERGIRVLHAPGRPPPPGAFGEVLGADDLAAAAAGYDLDVRPATDDRPFFFQMVRPRDLLDWQRIETLLPHALFPTATLVLLAGAAAVACLALLVLPGLRSSAPLGGSVRALLPFACLGIAYMAVEIGLVERMVLLVGEPTRALALVLAAMLLGSGLGGWTTHGVATARLDRAYAVAALVATGLAAALALGLTPAVEALLPRAPAVRGAVAGLACAAVGFALGRPFPLLLRAVAERSEDRTLTPWAWAINGAFGVLASVASLGVAIAVGFPAVLACGAAAYALATATGLGRSDGAG